MAVAATVLDIVFMEVLFESGFDQSQALQLLPSRGTAATSSGSATFPGNAA